VSGRKRVEPRAAQRPTARKRRAPASKTIAEAIVKLEEQMALDNLLRTLVRTGHHPSRRLLDATRELAGLWRPDPRARKATLNYLEAACILADVEQLAAKLGVSNEEARNKLAAKYGHASGEALGKWVRRARSGAGQKRR
jgi:hypothetical protein